jgi:hypothetical protein
VSGFFYKKASCWPLPQHRGREEWEKKKLKKYQLCFLNYSFFSFFFHLLWLCDHKSLSYIFYNKYDRGHWIFRLR